MAFQPFCALILSRISFFSFKHFHDMNTQYNSSDQAEKKKKDNGLGMWLVISA